MANRSFKLHTGNIFADSKEHSSQRPFLSSWISERIEEIEAKEPGVPRKGKPKKGPKPISRDRELFSLAKAVNDSLNLKNFSETFDQNYVVVRRWNNDPQVKKAVHSFRVLFANDFVEQIETILAGYDFDSPTVTNEMAEIENRCADHVKESCFYDLELQHSIEDVFDRKTSTFPDNQKTLWLDIFQWMTGGWVAGLDIHSPPVTKQGKKILVSEIIRQGNRYNKADTQFIDHLIKLHAQGEDISFWLENLKRSMLSTNDENTQLKISVVFKGRKVEEQDYA